ncbi:hypothetical protein VNO80_10281 [Phaseolus coccineus]|uniref:Uncharacterized protein n=1 Tax=Phaseolus coccineus TaxID=3886 RepID=A0AAN9ND45_PHACN
MSRSQAVLKEEGGVAGGPGMNWCCVGWRKDVGFGGAAVVVFASSTIEGLELVFADWKQTLKMKLESMELDGSRTKKIGNKDEVDLEWIWKLAVSSVKFLWTEGSSRCGQGSSCCGQVLLVFSFRYYFGAAKGSLAVGRLQLVYH